jgi:hypothetical protein
VPIGSQEPHLSLPPRSFTNSFRSPICLYSWDVELLDVRLTGIQRRNRAAFVRRADLPGAPALSPGQQVVLRDESGEFFAGTVVDVDDHERCLVHLGVRLPEEYAMLRLGRVRGRTGDGQELVQDVLDLLGDARSVLVDALPGQRRGR